MVVPITSYNYKLAKVFNCLIYLAPEFQVMIANGRTISYGIHNNNLTMGEYVLNILVISIPVGGAYVLLVLHWLQSLGTIDFNFQ